MSTFITNNVLSPSLIHNQPTLSASPINSNSELLVWDADTSTLRKITLDQIMQQPFTNKHQKISTAGTNATLVKSSPGTVGSIYFSTDGSVTVPVGGNGPSVIFLKIYDKASAPVVGVDIPVLTLVGAGYSEYSTNFSCVEPAGGISFTNGIAYAITNGPAVTDTTPVLANQAIVNIIYN